MAMLDLFQNRATKAIVICPYARDSICDKASGPLKHMTLEEFVRSSAKIVNEYFNEYDTRDPTIKSELYNTMASRDRRRFLAQHDAMTISHLRADSFAEIFSGPELAVYGTLDFPFDDDSFPEYVFRAFRGEPPE